MPWQILNISPTSDERAIKRAYAARLKQTRPEDDPGGFAQLREAFEFALHLARQLREQEASVEQVGTQQPDLPRAVAPLPAPVQNTAATDRLSDTPSETAPVQAEQARPTPPAPVQTVFWRDKQAALDRQIEDLRRAAFDSAVEDAELQGLAAHYGWLHLVEPPKALPHEWLHRVRRRLHERMVTALITTLAEHAMDRPQLALQHFHSVVETADWEALDLRSLLESALAQWLATREPAPLRFMQGIADWARWRDASGYARLGISPAATRVCQRIDLETTWETWQQHAHQPVKGEGNFRYRVFNMLLADNPPWRRRWRSLNHGTQLAVRTLANEIRYAYPELYRRLDPHNVAWWSRWHPSFGSANLLELLLAASVEVLSVALLGPVLENALPAWGLLLAFLIGALGGILCWLLTSELKFGWAHLLSQLGKRHPAMQTALHNGYTPFGALLGSLLLAIFPTAPCAVLIQDLSGRSPPLPFVWLGLSLAIFGALTAIYLRHWQHGIQAIAYLRRNWWYTLPLLLLFQAVLKAIGGKLA